MINMEEMIAESHDMLSTKLLMEKHGVSRRTVVRWHAKGEITLAGQIGQVHFYKEEKNPSSDKGEKRRKGEGIDKWFDPFDLQ